MNLYLAIWERDGQRHAQMVAAVDERMARAILADRVGAVDQVEFRPTRKF